MTKYDIKYIIRKILIYSGVALILMFVKSCNVKADSVCIQATWLGDDVRLTSGETNTAYTYGRFMGQCGSKVKIQIPIMFSTINTIPFENSSSIFRIDLTNGETYYGELKNGYLEFDNVRVNGNPAVSNLYVRYTQQGGNDWLLVSKYIQIFTIEDSNTINNNINNVNNSVNEVNNSINNDNVDNQQSSDFFTNFNSNVDGSLVTLIKKPIDIVNSFYNTCEPIVFHIPKFDIDLTIPCISSINNGFTSVIFPIARIIINGLLCYRLILAFIDVINKLKDPNNSDLEVVDL